MGPVLNLVLGVKRRHFRDNDPRSARAEREFQAKRAGALSRARCRCAGCGYESRQAGHLDVHHADDDHHNNQDDNLVAGCHTCHPYQHVGEIARRSDGSCAEALGKATLVASVPELDARDLNLLQRAIGMALLDDSEAETARKIMAVFEPRATWVKGEFGSFKAGDFAGAMAQLTDAQYARRGEAISDLRLLFNEAHLKHLGRQMSLDNPAMPVESWPAVVSGLEKKRRA